MPIINRPANNLLSRRLQKGLIKTEHWSYALKLIFASEEARKDFVENAYCQMFFYFDVNGADLKSTEMYRVKNVVYQLGSGTESTELYIKIPTPHSDDGEYVHEIAIHFVDMYGYLIATHNNSV